MEKYKIVVSGIELTISSDKSEEYAKGLAKIVSTSIDNTITKKAQCSKAEAAIMTALNLLDEKVKIKKDADLLAEENEQLRKELATVNKKYEDLRQKFLMGR